VIDASIEESAMSARPDEADDGVTLTTLRQTIREHGVWPEETAVTRLLHSLELTAGARHRAVSVASALVEGARARRDERPFLDAFLQEFGLSNQEGIALMCIAEALLRIPDDATADRLIAEQLANGDWSAHSGKSESLFVNASTWGLMLTGGISSSIPRSRGAMRPLGCASSRARPANPWCARGAPRDAHHRRRIRRGPHDRGGAGAQRRERSWRCAPSTCSAKGAHAAATPSAIWPTSMRSM
jgi:hypothetical protein